eukprot:Amastigsp_a342469_158.p2 type:complete len:130 gc:universal Amastigsp_a342469_158:648-259(-)
MKSPPPQRAHHTPANSTRRSLPALQQQAPEAQRRAQQTPAPAWRPRMHRSHSPMPTQTTAHSLRTMTLCRCHCRCHCRCRCRCHRSQKSGRPPRTSPVPIRSSLHAACSNRACCGRPPCIPTASPQRRA